MELRGCLALKTKNTALSQDQDHHMARPEQLTEADNPFQAHTLESSPKAE